METKEYRGIIDRNGWTSGAWDDEPDKIQWPDPDTGLACLIKRNRCGAWCGYVGVPRGHPWYGLGYDDVEPYPPVHGGLTFASKCEERDDETGICHVVELGEPDDVWWLGFDCNHFQDLAPGLLADLASVGIESEMEAFQTYKDIGYVREECRLLAQACVDQFRMRGTNRRRLWPAI